MDKRPFNDVLAEKVIDAQVKEIDRLHATNKDILRVNLEHANNIVQMIERISELEAANTRLGILVNEREKRIAELEAEREHAVYAYVSTRIAELEAEVFRLATALAGAANALKPFALEADSYDPLEGDDDRDTRSIFTMGELRRARTEAAYLLRLIGGTVPLDEVVRRLGRAGPPTQEHPSVLQNKEEDK
jgi:hypothetical protein